MGEHDVATGEMLEWCARELGIRSLLCEGGGILCARLFAARAVDELYVTLVPRILGGRDAPTLAEGAGFGPDEIPWDELAFTTTESALRDWLRTLPGRQPQYEPELYVEGDPTG